MHLGVGDDGFKHLDRFIRGVRNAKAMKSVNRINKTNIILSNT